jgi:tetratricopeptide (TPR) repeat protein
VSATRHTATPRHASGGERADSAGLVERGRAAFERGDLAAAETAFEEALVVASERGEALLGLGKIALHRGDAAQAAARFEQSIDAEPAPPEASVALARLRDLAGRTEDALDTLWLAVHRHPAHAAAWLELGRLLVRSGRVKEAEECLERSCAARPDWHEPCVELARTLQRMRRYADAVPAFRRAIELARCSPEVYNDLANCLVYLQRNDEALALFEELVRRYPRSLVARLGYANALFQLGRFDEAGVQYDLIRAREPENYFVHWNRSLLLLQRQAFDEGWRCYERRLFTLTENHPRVFPFPRWRGEPLAGKTILVYAEQGLGDEIMFASCFEELLGMGARCILECNPKLAAIFARSFPAAKVVAAEERALPTWLAGLGAVDFQVAAGSLPGFFRRSADRFPGRAFLKPDPDKVARWRRELARLGDGPKVGISWRGGSVRTRTVARSIGLADWAPILDVPGCRFVSLQYGDVGEEVRELNAGGTRRVELWQAALDDYDETAALVSALDLVVTVCTALVHLSGGLGRPAWVLVPSIPEWRYGLEGDRMPWYGSVELIRQPPGELWRPTLERAGDRLAAYVADRRATAAE